MSSLGENSKRLSASQVQSLEGLFAKRLNIASPTVGNTWLRKRLIVEYPLIDPLPHNDLRDVIAKQLEDILDDDDISRLNSNTISGCWHVCPIFRQPQTGPSCGIAALNMAVRSAREKYQDFTVGEYSTPEICDCIGEVNRSNDSGSAESLLELAQNIGISNDGELFCAYNLAYLSNSFFSIPLFVRELDHNSKINIVKSLLSGLPVLIPYDRSFSDHKPSSHAGTHAHWAVIGGFILLDSSNETFASGDLPTLIIGSYGSIRTLNSGSIPLESILDSVNATEVYVVCYHGMSNKPFVCTLSSLLDSCQQLKESKSKFYKSSEDMRHLRNKVVFFGRCDFCDS